MLVFINITLIVLYTAYTVQRLKYKRYTVKILNELENEALEYVNNFHKKSTDTERTLHEPKANAENKIYDRYKLAKSAAGVSPVTDMEGTVSTILILFILVLAYMTGDIWIVLLYMIFGVPIMSYLPWISKLKLHHKLIQRLRNTARRSNEDDSVELTVLVLRLDSQNDDSEPMSPSERLERREQLKKRKIPQDPNV